MPAFARSRGGPLTDEQVNVLAQGLKPHWGRPRVVQGPVPCYLVSDRGPRGERERGARVFQHACAGCHGDRGQGLKDDAGAINDRAFLSLISDQALRRLAITGRPDLGMPSYEGKDGRAEGFHALSSEEIDDLLAFLVHWRDERSPGRP